VQRLGKRKKGGGIGRFDALASAKKLGVLEVVADIDVGRRGRGMEKILRGRLLRGTVLEHGKDGNKT